jgi:hypothetical protein
MNEISIDECFYKINLECKILDIIENHIPVAKWKWVPWQHVCINLPREDLLGKDSFIDMLIKKGGRLCLYKIPANTSYNWHKDKSIGVSLNMVLTEYKCHTIFSTGHFEYMNATNFPILDNIIELKYEPKKWFLFNSQIRHSVMNLDHRDRYLLTIIFSKEHSYDELKKFLISYV